MWSSEVSTSVLMVQGLREPTSKDDQNRPRILDESRMDMDLVHGLKALGPQGNIEEMDCEVVSVNLQKEEGQLANEQEPTEGQEMAESFKWEPEPPKTMVSFRDAVAGSSQWFKEAKNVVFNAREWEDEDIPIPSDALAVTFPKETLSKLREPWRNALMGKVLGMSINRNFMNDRVRRMWKTQDRVEVIDLGNDVFLFRFNNREDLERALYGGPWFIMNHYLMLSRWKPDFRPSESGFDKISIWIRFPELPMEYYDKEALFMIAAKVGRPIKVDYATDNAVRGRYARVCIEVDLAIPLITKVWVGKAWQAVEYENLSLVCFECGKIGHRRDICNTREDNKVQEEGRRQKGKAAMKESAESSSYQAARIVSDPSGSVRIRVSEDKEQWKSLDSSSKDMGKDAVQENQENYGPWIVVTSGRKKNNNLREVRKGMGKYNQEKNRVLKEKNIKEGSGVRGSGERVIVDVNKWENLNRTGEDKEVNEELERSNDDIYGINTKVAGFFGINEIAAERIGERKREVGSPKDNNLHGKATSIPLPTDLNSRNSTIKQPILSSSSPPLHESYGRKSKPAFSSACASRAPEKISDGAISVPHTGTSSFNSKLVPNIPNSTAVEISGQTFDPGEVSGTSLSLETPYDVSTPPDIRAMDFRLRPGTTASGTAKKSPSFSLKVRKSRGRNFEAAKPYVSRNTRGNARSVPVRIGILQNTSVSSGDLGTDDSGEAEHGEGSSGVGYVATQEAPASGGDELGEREGEGSKLA